MMIFCPTPKLLMIAARASAGVCPAVVEGVMGEATMAPNQPGITTPDNNNLI
jgi:hypothetical protein